MAGEMKWGVGRWEVEGWRGRGRKSVGLEAAFFSMSKFP